MKRFYLVDCDNFYVSCERVFDPTLRNKPVVVLGSNDACVIARSNEAKALGIPMGVPAFEYASVFKKHNVLVYSANFTLYGDMSARVMQTLSECTPDVEVYSVDEAFVHVPEGAAYGHSYYTEYGHYIKKKVHQETGIPVTLGIGPTKTLAKVAHEIAKKNPVHKKVFDITQHPAIDDLLATIAIADVWGVGYRYAKLLQNRGILNARDFKYMNDVWVRKNMTIVGLKTMLELRGTSCLRINHYQEPKQTITVSRSFGKKVTALRYLKEAVAAYMSTAAEKLRAQDSLASRITVFIVTSRYHEPDNYFYAIGYQLPVATDYTPTLIDAAHICVEELYKPGLIYKKAGVVLTDLMPGDFLQMNTYVPLADVDKQARIMTVVDRLNTTWGRNKVFFAAAGTQQHWKMHQAKKSVCFTTNWHELLTIRV